jgi:hypothetical protein
MLLRKARITCRPETRTLTWVSWTIGSATKPAALADFRQVFKLDPATRQRLQISPGSVKALEAGVIFRPLEVIQDKEFLKQVLAQ